jgi:hypothetical protein
VNHNNVTAMFVNNSSTVPQAAEEPSSTLHQLRALPDNEYSIAAYATQQSEQPWRATLCMVPCCIIPAAAVAVAAAALVAWHVPCHAQYTYAAAMLRG